MQMIDEKVVSLISWITHLHRAVMISVLCLLSGSGGHSAQMTSYSDSGYQDSSVSYYSNQNVVRSEPRASISRSPRAEGQASGQVRLKSPGFVLQSYYWS